jgi:hypothetical protein
MGTSGHTMAGHEQQRRRHVRAVHLHRDQQASDAVLEMLSRQAGAGVPLTVKRYHLGGFTRAELS